MNIARHTLLRMNGILKRYGPSNIKALLWDKEFSTDKWNFIDNTAGDCVYPYLEKHLRKGSILDLGCGPGNTANELDAAAYQSYVGVDISEAALVKARRRTEANGRTGKNTFVQGDFFSYLPEQRFDVILFRESLYHVPVGRVKAILHRYAKYLNEEGVFVVRIIMSAGSGGKAKYRPKAMATIIESNFDVTDRFRNDESGVIVLVFRPKPSC